MTHGADHRPPKRRHRAGAALVLAAGLFVTPSLAAQTVFSNDADSLVLENDLVRFTFSRTYLGSIVGIADLDAGLELLGASLPYPAALFVVERSSGGCTTEQIHNLHAQTFGWATEQAPDGLRLVLSYGRLGLGDATIDVSVFLADGARRAEWRLQLDGIAEGTTARSVTFPLVAMQSTLGADPSDDTVAVPLLDGVILHNPTSALDADEGLQGTYPGDLSLQMAAVYDGNSGLYLAAHDPTGRSKTLGYTRADIGGTPAAVLQLRHDLSEADDGFPTYPVILGPFQGDWFDATGLYRDWILDRPWIPEPLSERGDVPRWWLHADPVISSAAYDDDGAPILPAADMPARAEEYSESLGRPVTLLTFGWERHGAWTTPEVFPPRDGNAAWESALARMHASDDHAYVYISGTVWRLTRAGLPDYDDSADFDAFGRAHAAETCEGDVLFDPFYTSIGWTSARMCPATGFWRQTVADNVAAAAELGIDVVSVDEFPIGSVYPCYANDHPHPVGSGTWQGAAYRRLLTEARTRGRLRHPDLVLTCEEPNELYVDLLDGYVSRDNQPDGLLYSSYLAALGDRFQTAPLFARVFHERALAVAEPTQLRLPDDHETLRTARVRSLAAAFVRGKVPSAAVDPIAEVDAGLLNLFRRISKLVAGAARPYVVTGTMLRPPELDVPTITFDWVYYDLASGGYEIRSTASPVVLAGAWRAPSGRRATLLTNITAEDVSLEVPLGSAGFPGGVRITRTIDADTVVVYTGDDPPRSVPAALPGFAVAMIEIGPRRVRPSTGRVSAPAR